MMKHPVNVAANSRAETPQPPQLVEDVGGSGESPPGVKFPVAEDQISSGAYETGSGDLCPFDTSPGIFPTIGSWIIRIVLYLAIFSTILIGSVYLAKLTGIYDICEGNTYVNTKCETEPYAKGFLYYVECTEETFCLLPGYWSSSRTAGWSLKKPEAGKIPNKEDLAPVYTDESPAADENAINEST